MYFQLHKNTAPGGISYNQVLLVRFHSSCVYVSEARYAYFDKSSKCCHVDTARYHHGKCEEDVIQAQTQEIVVFY